MAEGEDKSTAGAWAAAAIVLALGGLAFGVTAQLRITDLEERLDAMAQAPPVDAVVTTTTVAPRPPEADESPDGETSAAEPLDPDAARADIGTAFEVVYDGSQPTTERLERVDDPDGVGRAIAQVETGPLAQAAPSVTATVDNVSFTSDTRALVSYTLSFGGLADVSPRRGEARVVGGRWAVTRATVCNDLSALGASCA